MIRIRRRNFKPIEEWDAVELWVVLSTADIYWDTNGIKEDVIKNKYNVENRQMLEEEIISTFDCLSYFDDPDNKNTFVSLNIFAKGVKVGRKAQKDEDDAIYDLMNIGEQDLIKPSPYAYLHIPKLHV